MTVVVREVVGVTAAVVQVVVVVVVVAVVVLVLVVVAVVVVVVEGESRKNEAEGRNTRSCRRQKILLGAEDCRLLTGVSSGSILELNIVGGQKQQP